MLIELPKKFKENGKKKKIERKRRKEDKKIRKEKRKEKTLDLRSIRRRWLSDPPETRS